MQAESEAYWKPVPQSWCVVMSPRRLCVAHDLGSEKATALLSWQQQQNILEVYLSNEDQNV